jgi:hypothetical protein
MDISEKVGTIIYLLIVISMIIASFIWDKFLKKRQK